MAMYFPSTLWVLLLLFCCLFGFASCLCCFVSCVLKLPAWSWFVFSYYILAVVEVKAVHEVQKWEPVVWLPGCSWYLLSCLKVVTHMPWLLQVLSIIKSTNLVLQSSSFAILWNPSKLLLSETVSYTAVKIWVSSVWEHWISHVKG